MTTHICKRLLGLRNPRPIGWRHCSSTTNSLEVTVNEKTGVRVLRINRPKKYNAFNNELYKAFPVALKEAGDDWPRTRVTVLAGSTDSPYYSSGNDLSDFLAMFSQGNLEELSVEMARVLREFVDAFVDFGPGLLVASVHGPATGIAVTTLALCDAVYASDSVRLSTPFTKLSQSPEGCSTAMFPTLMGKMKAMDVLALGSTMTAREAQRHGLVTEVLPELCFEKQVMRRAERFASFPPEGFRDTIGLTKYRTPEQRQALRDINKRECENLVTRWQSEECMRALLAFSKRKK